MTMPDIDVSMLPEGWAIGRQTSFRGHTRIVAMRFHVNSGWETHGYLRRDGTLRGRVPEVVERLMKQVPSEGSW